MPFKDPEKRRAYERSPWRRSQKLKHKYGITVAYYNKLLAAQKGVCAICRTAELGNSGHNFFSVDHCHDSTSVRGLLCHRCNTGLGYFKDSPARLKSAAKYLERHRA